MPSAIVFIHPLLLLFPLLSLHFHFVIISTTVLKVVKLNPAITGDPTPRWDLEKFNRSYTAWQSLHQRLPGDYDLFVNLVLPTDDGDLLQRAHTIQTAVI